jgi:hypothetical protein
LQDGLLFHLRVRRVYPLGFFQCPLAEGWRIPSSHFGPRDLAGAALQK